MLNKDRILTRAKRLGLVMGVWTAAAGLSVGSMLATAAPEPSTASAVVPVATHAPKAHLVMDRSGSKQVGKASFYASGYSGRTMSNGKPMKLYSNNAASITLPLGTTARVTNLKTGLSAEVTIEDRGPYVKGRIIDLSPATARKIGISTQQGLAKVEVLPLTVPMLDGSIKVVANNGPKDQNRLMTASNKQGS